MNRWWRTGVLGCFAALGACSPMEAQIYYCDTTLNSSSFTAYHSLSLYDFDSCSVDSILYPYLAFLITDVAFHPSNFLVTYHNNPYVGEGVVSWLSIDTFDVYGFYSDLFDPTITGMATAPDSLVYMAGEGLSTFDIATQEIQYIGDFPPEMYCLGDITFREGHLYMSSVSNTLVEVDMEEPMNSSVSFAFPPDVPPIHGLVTLNYSCDSVITYAFGTDDVTEERKLYEVDFENETLIEVCDSGPFVYGACSPLEVLPPSCDVYVDPDADDNSGGENFVYLSDSICVGPVAVTDEDVLVYSVFGDIDSIRVNLAEIQDGDMEFLYASVIPSSLELYGDSTASLVFVDTDQAVYADFEMALAGLRYQNTASFFTSGFRQVYFRAFSGGYEGPLGLTELPLFHDVLQVASTEQDISCHGASDGFISVEPFGGVQPYQLQWSTGETSASIENLEAGTYNLEVSDAIGCVNEFDFTLDQPDTLLVVIINYGYPYVCDSVGELTPWVLGGVPPYSFSWSNGWEDSLLYDIPPGLYELTVTDSMGCQSVYSYELMPTSYTSAYADTICAGQSYSFGELLLTSDTSVCYTFSSVEGCDSLVCLDLTVRDTFMQLIEAEICQGDAFGFMGAWYDSDTLVCEVFAGANGCDSTWCLSLEVIQDVSFTHDSICPDETYFFEGEWLNEPGIYTDTLSNVQGCDSIIVLSLEVFPVQEVGLTAEGLLCEEEEVLLSANTFVSYDWSDGSSQPILYVDSPGVYVLSVVDENGCLFEDTIVVVGHDFFIDAGLDQSLKLGESVEVIVSANQAIASIHWFPSEGVFCDTCLQTGLQPLTSTTYFITAEDSLGCTASDELYIEVQQGKLIYIPNAFSPNGDGINDHFEIFPSPAVKRIRTFTVFDRWGNQLFSASSDSASSLSWDGRSADGQPLPEGIYTWLVEAELLNGQTLLKKGELVLIR